MSFVIGFCVGSFCGIGLMALVSASHKEDLYITNEENNSSEDKTNEEK